MNVPTALPERSARWRALDEGPLDVAIVGGGVTGAGIALDLALRGLRVAVFERGDWAAATSSASSRLIHGGLRYLEQLEFALVRDSCLERGLLLRNAAGLVWPERFTFPVRAGDRVGRLKLAAGLALYTLVSVPRVLGVPGMPGRAEIARRVPGIGGRVRGGGSYLDGATDDARLTLAVALTAVEEGAAALSRVEVESVDAAASGVELAVHDLLDGERRTVRARAAVLAAGPFTDALRGRAGLGGRWLSPTRGSHVVVPRERLPTDGAVIFPSPVDQRVMFLIPWPRYTIVGTTDLEATSGELHGAVRATRAEVRYLLDSANGLVPGARLTEDDVVSTWAGLRPLLAADERSPSARSREERVEHEGRVWTIAGGKLTGYRSMAEGLGARIAAQLGRGYASRRSPTRARRLRGALDEPAQRPAWSSLARRGGEEPVLTAWSRRYAAFRAAVLDECGRVEEGRRALDAETLLGEVDWAVRHEDCLTAEDFFLRRTDLAFGPRDAAASCREAVLDRLAARLSWNALRRRAEEERLERALGLPHAWRGDPA